MGKRKYKYITISSEERLALAMGADILDKFGKGYDNTPLTEYQRLANIIKNLLERSKHEENGTK